MNQEKLHRTYPKCISEACKHEQIGARLANKV